MSVMEEIRDLALDLALLELEAGVREVGGRNRGPRVEQYLKSVGLGPGHPWCCAAVIHCYGAACGEHGLPLVLPRTGKVVRLFQAVPLHFLRPDPVAGALCGHATNPEDPDSDGHIGWVTEVGSPYLPTLEANTNDAGSREGDRWAKKARLETYWNLGYIDIAQERAPLEL